MKAKKLRRVLRHLRRCRKTRALLEWWAGVEERKQFQGKPWGHNGGVEFNGEYAWPRDRGPDGRQSSSGRAGGPGGMLYFSTLDFLFTWDISRRIAWTYPPGSEGMPTDCVMTKRVGARRMRALLERTRYDSTGSLRTAPPKDLQEAECDQDDVDGDEDE